MTKKAYAKRSDEERIAALEAKMEAIKRRAASREARKLPEAQALIQAVRAMDKASRVAAEAGKAALVQALEGTRAGLGQQLVELGVRLPAAETRGRGRRKGQEAA